jgi:hypothetical protein
VRSLWREADCGALTWGQPKAVQWLVRLAGRAGGPGCGGLEDAAGERRAKRRDGVAAG